MPPGALVFLGCTEQLYTKLKRKFILFGFAFSFLQSTASFFSPELPKSTYLGDEAPFKYSVQYCEELMLGVQSENRVCVACLFFVACVLTTHGLASCGSELDRASGSMILFLHPTPKQTRVT